MSIEKNYKCHSFLMSLHTPRYLRQDQAWATLLGQRGYRNTRLENQYKDSISEMGQLIHVPMIESPVVCT